MFFTVGIKIDIQFFKKVTMPAKIMQSMTSFTQSLDNFYVNWINLVDFRLKLNIPFSLQPYYETRLELDFALKILAKVFI